MEDLVVLISHSYTMMLPVLNNDDISIPTSQ